MHELFANVRGPGGFIGIHSGGWRAHGSPGGEAFGTAGTDGHIRVRPGELVGPGAEEEQPEWCMTYLSIILALTDVGEGDGATESIPTCCLPPVSAQVTRLCPQVLVPGSHKSVFLHPRVHGVGGAGGEGNMRVDGRRLEGAMEVHLKAGDAVRSSHDSLLT